MRAPGTQESPEPEKTPSSRSPEDAIGRSPPGPDRRSEGPRGSKAAKQSPEGKAFVAARSAVKRAKRLVVEAEDAAMALALEDALGVLEVYAAAAGLVARR